MSKRARETEPVTVLEKRYAIEVIVAARRTDESLLDDSNDPESEWFGFGWDYQIKVSPRAFWYTGTNYLQWEGYPDNENTWEPFEHIRNCLSQVVEFWEDAGHDTLLVNVPDFEVHARPEWLRKHRSSPMPTASTPKKTKRNRSQSQNRKNPAIRSPRTPPRRRPTPAHKSSTIRIPVASSSKIQTPRNSSSLEAPTPTPTAPISPPLTPEPELAASEAQAGNMPDTHGIPHVSPTLDALDASEVLQGPTSSLLEPNPHPGPTFVPDYTSPPRATDISFNTWLPAHSGFGIEEDSTDFIPPPAVNCDFADYLTQMPPDELLNWAPS